MVHDRELPLVTFTSLSQQTQNNSMIFVQRRPNVFDVGPTLYKWYSNTLCLLDHDYLWICGHTKMV